MTINVLSIKTAIRMLTVTPSYGSFFNESVEYHADKINNIIRVQNALHEQTKSKYNEMT